MTYTQAKQTEQAKAWTIRKAGDRFVAVHNGQVQLIGTFETIAKTRTYITKQIESELNPPTLAQVWEHMSKSTTLWTSCLSDPC